jgi:GT2 family glycosyltransferase
VVPTWNGADHLRDCLESLARQTIAAEVVVVDNGSSDGSPEIARSCGAAVLELDRNTGFAGAANRGIEWAIARGAGYVALLNNDAIAEADWLERLHDAAERHPEAGTVTAKVLRSDRRTLDSTGDFYSVWGWPTPRGRDEPDDGRYDEAEWVFAGSGAASLYRVAMLEDVGVFDERYFAYFEDVDLGFRSQLLGWRVRYEPSARAYHEIGATSSRMAGLALRRSAENFVYLFAKNMPGRLALRYLARFLAGYALMLAALLRRGHVAMTVAVLARVARASPALLRERRALLARRRASDAQIDALLLKELPQGIMGWRLVQRVRELAGRAPS